jgi:hypothetical protein
MAKKKFYILINEAKFMREIKFRNNFNLAWQPRTSEAALSGFQIHNLSVKCIFKKMKKTTALRRRVEKFVIYNILYNYFFNTILI